MTESKKNKLRFTLRMNPNDPVQMAATRILNTKGHRISDYIAHTVLAYEGIQQNNLSASDLVLSEDKNAIKQSHETIPSDTKEPPDSMFSMLDGLGDLKKI